MKNPEVRVGVELKMAGSAVLSKNSFGKKNSKYIHLFTNGLVNIQLNYSYLRTKISVLRTLSLSLHSVFLCIWLTCFLIIIHSPTVIY